MNANIIRKCLEELGKKDFRKDYVIGLLESYYDMLTPNTMPIVMQTTTPEIKEPFVPGSKKAKKIEHDEEEIPEFLRAGAVGNITQS